jgi:hypothetical protein
MDWTKTVNHAAMRNKKRMEDAGFSTDHFGAIADVHEIEEKLPGVILPKDVQEKIAKAKEKP